MQLYFHKTLKGKDEKQIVYGVEEMAKWLRKDISLAKNSHCVARLGVHKPL